MSFRLLRRTDNGADGGTQTIMADQITYGDHGSAVAGAENLCKSFGWVVVIVEEVGEVSMNPTLKSLRQPAVGLQHNLGPDNGQPSGLPQPTIPHRLEPDRNGDPVLTQEQLAKAIELAKEEGPPRVPQARPRLLVLVDREPTHEERMTYMMIVGPGGRVCKNAFGSLDLDDMPLNTQERLEVKRAMGASK